MKRRRQGRMLPRMSDACREDSSGRSVGRLDAVAARRTSTREVPAKILVERGFIQISWDR